MRNQQIIKLFLVLILCTTYIFSFSHFGALAYDSVINGNDQFSEGTMIGSLAVAGKSKNEALVLTDEQLTKWLNETTFTIKYKEKSLALETSYFSFDIESTVRQAQPGVKNPVVVQLEPLDDLLYSLSPSIDLTDILLEKLQAELLRSATMLEIGDYQVRLENFLADGSTDNQSVIAEATIDSKFVENELDLFVGKRLEVGATSQFSLLKYVEEEIGKISPVSLSKIATAMFESVLPTNFTIIERHISSELPEYASLGYEAKADAELNYDLVFTNPNEFSYFIEFEKKNGSIYVYLKGAEFLNSYAIVTEGKETFEPKTIRQFNPLLGPTEIKVKVEGKEGLLIKLYREHRDENGAVMQKELISEDFYPPIHQVEVQGLIVKEGNSIIIPGTEAGEENGDSDNSDSTDSDGSNNNDGDPNNPDGQSDDDDLWGKDNEIPK